MAIASRFEMLDTFGPLEMFAVANRLLVQQGECAAFELTSAGSSAKTCGMDLRPF